jgi:hypothetical protein
MLTIYSDTLCLDHCQMVKDEAETILADLATYGIVAQDLANLQDAIEKYLEWLPKPRTAIVNRRNLTRQVAEYLDICAKKLAIMTVHVRMLESVDPVFYNTFLYSRKIVNTGYHKLPLRGIITNQSNVKLGGAIVSINSIGVSTISTDLGYFEFKSIPAGVYNATIELEGYETITRQVAIVANKRTDLNVSLTEGNSLRVAS